MPFSKNSGCVVYLPKSYDKTKSYPCIIFLHGMGERGDGSDAGLQILENFLSNQWNGIGPALEALDKYILIAPQLPNTFGNWENQYVEKGMILMQNYGVNYKRVYITGVSLGGGGLWKYLTTGTNSQKFAAAYSVCGVGGWTDLCAIKCPVWAIHAINDSVVGVGNTHGAIDGINACKPPVRAHKTILPTGDHYIWGPAYSHTVKPGVENVTYWQWLDLNEQGSPVAVPTTITPNPAAPAPITNGLTPVAEVKNITINSATLDGSKSQGQINYASWVMIKQPPGSDWNVFPNFDKSGLVKDLKNLAVGNYEFELTLKGPNGIAKTVVAFTVSQATPKVLASADIPQGKTKVTYLDNNTFSFS